MGAEQAGLELDWAMEREAWKAEVYNQNLGNHCVVGDVRRADWSSFRTPFWWHASPPCTTASKANPNQGETLLDIILAAAIRRGICQLRPRRFSLENVWDYSSYFSFRRILATLQREGYAIAHWHLDAANYGVPQNRKRLILVASRDHQPRRPMETHQKPDPTGQGSLFTQPWRGWFDAVKHRIEEFTDSDWANWQIPRLPKEWHLATEPFMVCGGNTNKAEAKPGKGVRRGDQPAQTITGGDRRNIRAFIMHGGNSGSSGDRYRYDTEPSFTVTAQAHRLAHRAYLVSGGDATIRRDEQPSFTLCASSGGHGTTPRARISGRVVQLSVGALADLQDFPPHYKLPATKTKACDIIGNAVPPGLMRAVIAANR